VAVPPGKQGWGYVVRPTIDILAGCRFGLAAERRFAARSEVSARVYIRANREVRSNPACKAVAAHIAAN